MRLLPRRPTPRHALPRRTFPRHAPHHSFPRLSLRRVSLALLACAGLLSSSAAPAVSDPVVRKFSYGSHARQTVTVYGDHGPALVIVHGGYWADDTDWSRWARWFATEGFRVYDVDYRLNSDARWPAQRTDALAALDWVARHSGMRPVVLGSSAGGQIATVAGGYGEGASRVRGVVALSPVATPRRAWTDGGRATASAKQQRLRKEARRLAGCTPSVCPAQWRSMAAATYASGPDDAPLFLVHSASEFVPPAHSRDLSSAARGAGLGDVTVRTVAGSAHGAALLSSAAVRGAVVDWLRSRSG
ncbi:alpha/beta hydrolase [Streptomyces sp. TRM66268-LWL]|uniref:Alpha/beta hydrolase n=1 Tax=Streptomyces polyasparticus TaxID=2767826 RepID=A0ABR7SQ95_9ACTN|nr:alpha/beta hydrolase [Streptomyces polyasparticus]MBC9716696.1 alpha/beta hydrolase [Streptomyces polyasparticus]